MFCFVLRGALKNSLQLNRFYCCTDELKGLSCAGHSLHSGSCSSGSGLRIRYQSDAGTPVRPPVQVAACVPFAATAVCVEIVLKSQLLMMTIEVWAVICFPVVEIQPLVQMEI